MIGAYCEGTWPRRGGYLAEEGGPGRLGLPEQEAGVQPPHLRAVPLHQRAVLHEVRQLRLFAVLRHCSRHPVHRNLVRHPRVRLPVLHVPACGEIVN
eukprot:509623-Rhodomonas_salina.1